MINPVYSPAPDRYERGIRYRRCGRSGILLPEISLGFWHNFGDVNPLANSLEMAHYAFDHGIVHFDLANNYGPSYGSAEETFGQIMKKSFIPFRDELFISSKAGYDMWPGPYGEWGSRKYLMASLDQSLKRMNLDYVDLFYSHRFDPKTPLEETLKDRDVPCLIYQGRYNMLNREPESSGLLDQAKENGVGFIAFSPLAQGLLTGRYLEGIPADSRMAKEKFLKSSVLTPEMHAKLVKLNGIAARRGQTLAEMALAWCLKDDRVTSVIIGASRVSQIEDDFKALENIAFSAEELAEIDAVIK